jgi:hypothetical protein
MPRFSIGIPTYKRANLLRRSIKCAVEQSYPDIEVIVSDNGSPDETEDVIKSFGDRVRHHRNPTNIGAVANFKKTLDLATGEFFSWLQDDDLIHRDFASRAMQGFAIGDDIAAYLCFSVITPSPTAFYYPMLSGPTFPLRWMHGEMSAIDGILLAPVSFFYSPGNPPALAYRTETLREAFRTAKHRCELFDERILLATAAADRRVVMDPWAGAIFSHHDDQSYKVILRTDPTARERQWQILADALGELLVARGDSWKAPLMDHFRDVDPEHRLRWLNEYCPNAPQTWRKAHPIAGEVRKMLISTIPPERQREILSKDESFLNAVRDRLKSTAKDFVPPILLNAIRAARRS